MSKHEVAINAAAAELKKVEEQLVQARADLSSARDAVTQYETTVGILDGVANELKASIGLMQSDGGA